MYAEDVFCTNVWLLILQSIAFFETFKNKDR